VMIDCYYGQKAGGPSGFQTKVMNSKTRVQAVTHQINGLGTPLSKIPSGCGLRDVREQFILSDYKAVMGEVSLCYINVACHGCLDANSTY
jgi:hypothetical protein